MAIYEVHPGSWKRHPGREDEGFYTYRIGQAMRVLGEMRRHPIENHADVVFVEIIDKIHEILRRSIAGSRRIVSVGGALSYRRAARGRGGFHIIQKIMHPAHIPFEIKVQAALFYIPGHHRPGNEAENYILVLSHDEVVHLKCSMLNKMPGLGRDKYDNLKVGYAFMMGHPGKNPLKLLSS